MGFWGGKEMKNANQCFGQRREDGVATFNVIKPGLVEVLFGPGISRSKEGAALET